MSTIATQEELPTHSRPFPLAPPFGYGGHLKMHTGAHVWWTEGGRTRSGVIREIHRGSVKRVFGNQCCSCRGTPEDKALLIETDDTGEPVLLNESRCRRAHP